MPIVWRLSRASPTPQTSPADWASESCRLVDQRALYPRSHQMNARYLHAMRPLAERRVVQAADRLAGLLNELLASPAASPAAHR